MTGESVITTFPPAIAPSPRITAQIICARMARTDSARYVIIGAGVHGLSTGWHLAKELKARGKGSGEDVLILDKTGIGAGPSGLACGVVRNNYFQPAMRRLMAHNVSIWESDPEAFHYHPVGFMQISPEVMHADVAQIFGEQQAIGYESVFVEGGRLPGLHARHVPGLAGAWHHLRPSREEGRICGEHALDARARRQGSSRRRGDPRRRPRDRCAARGRLCGRRGDRPRLHRMRAADRGR